GLTLLTAASIGLTAGVLKLWREADANRRFAVTAVEAAKTERGDADAARQAAAAAAGRAGRAEGQPRASAARRAFELRDVGLTAVLSPDGTRLVTTSEDGRLQVWDLTTRRVILTARNWAVGTELLTAAFSADGNTIVAVDSVGTAFFLDA